MIKNICKCTRQAGGDHHGQTKKCATSPSLTLNIQGLPLIPASLDSCIKFWWSRWSRHVHIACRTFCWSIHCTSDTPKQNRPRRQHGHPKKLTVGESRSAALLGLNSIYILCVFDPHQYVPRCNQKDLFGPWHLMCLHICHVAVAEDWSCHRCAMPWRASAQSAAASSVGTQADGTSMRPKSKCS